MVGFFLLVRCFYLTSVIGRSWLAGLKLLFLAVGRHQAMNIFMMLYRSLSLHKTAAEPAVLEVLHGLMELVMSLITATLPQIDSRLYVIWGILHGFPENWTHSLVSSLVISWSITVLISIC